MTSSVSEAYIQAVAQHPELPHAAVRLGLWFVAVAEQTGGFPVKAFLNTILLGYHDGKVDVPGVSFRPPTVTAAIEALERAGLMRVEVDSEPERGHYPRLFTVTVG